MRKTEKLYPVRKLHKEQRNFSNGAGFTLIELVIVLALLAIIAAMAVAKFVDLGKKSIDVQEDVTIGGLRTAVLLYRANYDQWPGCSDVELFKLMDNSPPYKDLEHSSGGSCPRDNRQWCVFKFIHAGWPANPCTIECPHFTAALGVNKIWEYYGPGTEAIGQTPGSIRKIKNLPH